MRGNNAHKDAEEEMVAFCLETKFHANVDKVKAELLREIQPGEMEKIPHCKIHRVLLHRQNSSAPELVVLCCAQCGTWRNTSS
jgi:hypothetical protein